MQTITTILQNQTLSESLAYRSPELVEKTDEPSEISVYCDKKATDIEISTCFQKVIASYPAIFSRMKTEDSQNFFRMLKEAIEYTGMSGQQLYDATMHCICNNRQDYSFQISDITSYDHNVKLYTYSWACDKSGFVMSKLKRQVGDTWEYWWCRAQDLEKVNRIAERQNKQ